MITLNQIKDAIVGKLAKGGFRVFDERIRAPDLAQGAVVQVMLEPLTSQIVGGGIYEERSLMADCAWVEAEVSPLGAMYDAVEGMGRALQPGIPVGNRQLRLENCRYNLADGVAHYLFDLHYTDRIVEEDDYEYMATLKIETEESNHGNA